MLLFILSLYFSVSLTWFVHAMLAAPLCDDRGRVIGQSSYQARYDSVKDFINKSVQMELYSSRNSVVNDEKMEADG